MMDRQELIEELAKEIAESYKPEFDNMQELCARDVTIAVDKFWPLIETFKDFRNCQPWELEDCMEAMKEAYNTFSNLKGEPK